MDRRQLIATTGIALIAEGGTHRLTHRAVDGAAGLPAGSTSYYARTRRDLLRLIIEELSAASSRDIDTVQIPEHLTVAQASDLVVSLVTAMSQRRDAQAARFALMFEVRNDPELRRALTIDAPVRTVFHTKAANLLQALGVRTWESSSAQLVALVDALLMYQAVEAAPVDVAHIVEAYLRDQSSTQLRNPTT